MAKSQVKNTKKNSAPPQAKDPDLLVRMSHAEPDRPASIAAMIPAIVFGAVVILLIHQYRYTRPMSGFFWTELTDESTLSEFFSHIKMVAVVICAVLALLVMLYRLTNQSLAIRKSKLYIPMAVYTLFVLVSYAASEFKPFALLGYNERFEGTVPIVAYMVMLFYVFNFVRSERNVKMMIWPLAVSSLLLGLIGVTQATGHDFFRTRFGQKLIVGLFNSQYTRAIDEAMDAGHPYFIFAFKNNEIYQTVYNINYVSFYLTLLIPLFAMLFIRAFNMGKEEKLWKKIALGALFALLIYNFIGSASSGGYLGLAVIALAAVIVLNKQILKWIKPLAILAAILVAVLGLTWNVWSGEISNTVGAMEEVTETDISAPSAIEDSDEPAGTSAYFDYIVNDGDLVALSVYGNPMYIVSNRDTDGTLLSVSLLDENGEQIELMPTGEQGEYTIQDPRFYKYMRFALLNDGQYYYAQLQMKGYKDIDFEDAHITFRIKPDGICAMSAAGNEFMMSEVEHTGFERHQRFGSGRGYLWSRTFPLLKDRILIGSGADTFPLVFPQGDYAGQYNAQYPIGTIVDKPHNMFLGTWVGTGLISLLAQLMIYGIYMVQSFRLYFRREFGSDFLSFAGAGIFFGVTAFVATGLVNDSTISVMPMFYALLGMGAAINFMIKKRSVTKA